MSSFSPKAAEQLVRRLTDGLVNIKDETGEFTITLEDGSSFKAKEWNVWDWPEGVALTALYEHSALMASPATQYSTDTIITWFETQYKETKGKGAPKNINTMAPLFSLAGLLQDKKITNKKWSVWCEEWAEYVINAFARTQEGGFQHVTYTDENKDELWDDTLMMTVLPLTKIGLLLNRPHYVEEAKYQFLLHIRYLTDTKTGLWYHGWQFTDDGRRGHNFANALWARGNSWITVAIPLFLSNLENHLDKNDAVYRTLVAAFRRQVDALLPLQDESGLWHTLLDDPSSYLESSASAGFAAGIFSGIRQGILVGGEYRASAEKALKAVVDNILPNGELDKCSYGTPMGHNLDFYRKIPITPMPYGQALALSALVELVKLQHA